MKRLLLSFALFASMALPQAARPPYYGGGAYDAASFGQWSLTSVVPVAATGTHTIAVAVTGLSLPGGPAFQPLAPGLPLAVLDGTASETIIPSKVACSGGICQVTADWSHSHPNFTLASADGGLQEAVNFAIAAGGGVVRLDPDFVLLGSIPILSLAQGATDTLIEDSRAGSITWYGWTGSAYAPVAALGATGFTSANPPLATDSVDRMRLAEQFPGNDIVARTNAAITSLAGAGGAVFVPYGTYTARGAIVVPSNVEIISSGAQITQAAPHTPTFLVTGSNVTLRGFRLTGLGTDYNPSGGTTARLIDIEGGSNIHIEGNALANFGYCGVFINATRVWVTGNSFIGPAGIAPGGNYNFGISSGQLAAPVNQQVTITGNFFTGMASGIVNAINNQGWIIAHNQFVNIPGQHALYLDSFETIVADNIMDAIHFDGIKFVVDDGDVSDHTGIVITDNTIAGAADWAVNLSELTSATHRLVDVQVSGNVIQGAGAGGDCITFRNGSGSGLVNSGTFKGNTCDGTRYGFYFANDVAGTLANNEIRNTTGPGIYIAAGSSNENWTVIGNNLVAVDTAGAPQAAAIYFTTSSVLLKGNTITGLGGGTLHSIASLAPCAASEEENHYDAATFPASDGCAPANASASVVTALTATTLYPAQAQAVLAGTAGTARCSESLQGASLKIATCYLAAYSQTGSAQTFLFPASFATSPVLQESGGGCGAYHPATSATALTLPANPAMAPETCTVVLIGQ